MSKLSKHQLKSFRRFRDKGFTISEARRVARMNYHQLAAELSRRLQEISNAELKRREESKNPNE